MRKKTSSRVALLAALLIILGSPALAQQAGTDSAETQKPGMFRALDKAREAKDKLEERDARMQERIEDKALAVEERKAQIEERRQQFQDKFQDRKEKMDERRCKNIETRVDSRLKRYENDQQMLENVYGNMQARFARLVARLDSAGADTAKLKADLGTLDSMIEKLYGDHAAFMESLKTTRSSACGQSEGEFKGKLGEARNVLPRIKEQRAEIREFFKTTIKPDLETIRQQLESEKTETEVEKAQVEKPETEKPEASATATTVAN